MWSKIYYLGKEGKDIYFVVNIYYLGKWHKGGGYILSLICTTLGNRVTVDYVANIYYFGKEGKDIFYGQYKIILIKSGRIDFVVNIYYSGKK